MLYTESWESGSVQAKPYQPRDIVVDRTHDGNSLPKAFRRNTHPLDTKFGGGEGCLEKNEILS
jgi:hypothetical protein